MIKIYEKITSLFAIGNNIIIILASETDQGYVLESKHKSVGEDLIPSSHDLLDETMWRSGYVFLNRWLKDDNPDGLPTDNIINRYPGVCLGKINYISSSGGHVAIAGLGRGFWLGCFAPLQGSFFSLNNYLGYILALTKKR